MFQNLLFFTEMKKKNEEKLSCDCHESLGSFRPCMNIWFEEFGYQVDRIFVCVHTFHERFDTRGDLQIRTFLHVSKKHQQTIKQTHKNVNYRGSHALGLRNDFTILV